MHLGLRLEWQSRERFQSPPFANAIYQKACGLVESKRQKKGVSDACMENKQTHDWIRLVNLAKPFAHKHNANADTMAEAGHPIFRDIKLSNMAALQQLVRADVAVLEEREGVHWHTPLIFAIYQGNPTLAQWIIGHRGQHDLETADFQGWTALHHASSFGPLQVVQALVAAGGKPAALGRFRWTPLMCASARGFTDIVAFLLKLPAVKAGIDQFNVSDRTALSWASRFGHQPVVQLLLDAGADPTIPAGPSSPLRQALDYNHQAIAALLRHNINEAERARALHKARRLLDVEAGGAQLACLGGRAEQGVALPQIELVAPPQRLSETAAFATRLSDGLYNELLEYMVPGLWADKGPTA